MKNDKIKSFLKSFSSLEHELIRVQKIDQYSPSFENILCEIWVLLNIYNLSPLSEKSFFEFYEIFKEDYSDKKNTLLNFVLSYTEIDTIDKIKSSEYILLNDNLDFVFKIIYDNRLIDFDNLINGEFIYCKSNMLQAFIDNNIIDVK